MLKNSLSFKRFGERLLHWIEIILGTVVIFSVLLMTARQTPIILQSDWSEIETFIHTLQIVLHLAIGVEVARLLFSYSLETIIELAVFVVARKLFLIEDDFFSLLLGIIAIVVLFIARHFFMEDDAKCKKSVEQGSHAPTNETF